MGQAADIFLTHAGFQGSQRVANNTPEQNIDRLPTIQCASAEWLQRVFIVELQPHNTMLKTPVSDLPAMKQIAERVSATLSPAELSHTVEWLALAPKHSSTEELWFLIDTEDDNLTGVAMLPAPLGTIEYALGDWVFFKWPVRKFQIYKGPLTLNHRSQAFIRRVLRALAVTMPPCSVVFASGVPVDSALHAELVLPGGGGRKEFFVLPWGNETPHCRIAWQGRVETYLQSIGKESRRNLRRYAKKLLDDPALSCRIKRFTGKIGAEEFMRTAASLSAKTYQAKILGVGLTRNSLEEAQIEMAAERDAFLGHILYIDGEPAAFHFGVIHGDRLFALQMGYDPKWSNRQVGSVLFFEVLKDLERSNVNIRYLDYMSGVTNFKLRTANDKHPTRSFYLFRRTPIGALQYATLVAVNRFSHAVGAVLHKLRLKARLQAFIRHTARRRSPGAVSVGTQARDADHQGQ